MNIIEILEGFIARVHRSGSDEPFPTFIRCYDEDANDVDVETASANWPSRQNGELVAQTPEAGNGHYAHLQLRTVGGGVLGERAHYVLVAPDWSLVAHVTQPAIGGAADVIVEEFTGPTAGAFRFATGASQRP